MTRNLETLQKYLEEYLKQEGLYRVLLSQNKSSLQLNKLVVGTWLVGVLLVPSLLILVFKGFDKWVAATTVPIVSFLLYSLIVVIVLAIKLFKDGRRTLSNEDAGLLGGIFLFGWPVFLTIGLSLYLSAWQILFLYPVLYIFVLAVLVLIEISKQRLLLFFEMFIALIKVLPRSLALLVTLVPLLIILTLFSAFAEDLWAVIGNSAPIRFFGGIGVILLPVIVFAIARLDQESQNILGAYPRREEILAYAKDIPFIQDKLKRGYVSSEEWAEVDCQLAWRDTEKMAETIIPPLHKTIRHRFSLLLVFVSLALTTLFFIYFCCLFLILFEPQLIARWSDYVLEVVSIPIQLRAYSWTLTMPNTHFAVAKISFLLSVFIAATTIVSLFTDDAFKKTLTSWLIVKAHSWLAASSLYQCATQPNYQIWEYVVDDKKKGQVNVSIVVPLGLSDKEVELACEDMAERVKEYKWLIIITAFEQNEQRRYRRGIAGRRWELFHNKAKNIKRFQPTHLELDDLRYQHFLGREYLENGKESEIPGRWFGEQPTEQEVARAIWESDAEHDLILHSYAVRSDAYLSIEVQFMRRLSKSEFYREHIQNFIDIIRRIDPAVENIMLALNYRDTVDILASLNWMGKSSIVYYKDELTNKQKIEKPSHWQLPAAS